MTEKAKPRYQKQRYDCLRAQKKCVECGKSDENTRAGRCRCESCTDKFKKYQREFTQRRIAAGLCIKCGKKSNGYTYCKECRIKRAEFYRQQRYSAD